MDDEAERIARLEAQMETVLRFDARLTRLERVMYAALGAAGVGGLSGVASLLEGIGF